MTVRKARIGDILELQRRSATVALDQSVREIGVRSFGRGLFVKDATTGADIGSKRVFWIEPGDLVVSNIFAWEGAVAVAHDSHAEMAGSHRFMTWTAVENINLQYLAHYLVSEPGLAQLGSASPGSAGRNRTLSIKNFEAIEVPLPSIEEQRRIAGHLERVARSTEDLSARASSHDASLPAAQLPKVTAAWIHEQHLPRVTVGDLVGSVNDTVHPGDDPRGASEFVGLEHVEPHTGRLLGSRPVGDETGRKFRFEESDVSFGYLRPYLNKVWAADRVGLCSVEQFVLRPVDAVSPHLVAHVLRSSIVLDAAVAATNRLQLPRLRLATLMGMDVPDVRQASGNLLSELDTLRDRFVQLGALRARRRHGFQSLLPAARNEVFSSLR